MTLPDCLAVLTHLISSHPWSLFPLLFVTTPAMNEASNMALSGLATMPSYSDLAMDVLIYSPNGGVDII